MNAVKSETRAACCMLWVTMTTVYNFFNSCDKVLDPGRGDRVDGRARLVEEDDLRLDGQGPGDAQPLLLAAGKVQGVVLQTILHLVPQGGLPQAPLDDFLGVSRSP